MRLLLVAVIALLTSACGSDTEAAGAESTRSAFESSDPLADIPPEELYGASPAASLWNPRIELEVLNLPEGWRGAQVAVISDLQLGGWEGNEEVAHAAVQNAVQANPDLFVLIGDFLSEGDDTAVLSRVLAPLQGQPAFAVLGERDIRSDSLEARVTSTLQQSGVQVLRNSASAVVIEGDTAWIAGVDPDLVTMTAADQNYVLATLGVPGRTPILVSPAPGLAARAPEDRFPIVITGGTFCGDVEVPGALSLQDLSEDIFPGGVVEGIDRLFVVEGSTVLVSCGIGYGYIPMRFGSAPEVPILTITGGPTPVAADTAAVDSLLADTTTVDPN